MTLTGIEVILVSAMLIALGYVLAQLELAIRMLRKINKHGSRK